MAPFDRPWLSIGPPVQIQLCLVPFLSYLTLNNIVTLISALEVTQLKVIQTGTIWKLGYSFLFAFHSSLTMAVSCIILEIKRDIGQKSWFFISPCVWCPRYGDSRRNIAIPFGMKKTRMMGLPDGEKSLTIWLPVSTQFTNVTDTQMDRQTDTAWRHRPRLCITSHGRKGPMFLSMKLCHFQWPWTLFSRSHVPFFDAEYLTNSYRYGHS